MADLERYLEKLTIFNLKLAPKKAYIGVRVIMFLGHRVTAKGVEPDPGKSRSYDQVTHAFKRQSVTITVGCFVVLPKKIATSVNCYTTS